MNYKEMEEALANAKPASFDAPAAELAPASAVNARTAVLIDSIVKAVAPHIVALEKQIAALQARVVELESGTMRYCGVYQPSASYQRGHVVTCDGSAWCATRNVSAEKPPCDGWQLMVKHGKDAPAANPRHDAAAASSPRENGQHSNPRLR